MGREARHTGIVMNEKSLTDPFLVRKAAMVHVVKVGGRERRKRGIVCFFLH